MHMVALSRAEHDPNRHIHRLLLSPYASFSHYWYYDSEDVKFHITKRKVK